jgi:uncharacterized membrane protein
VAAAMAPETFSASLSRRSDLDQGLVTGLATGLHYLLSVGTQDALAVAGHVLPGRTGRAGTLAADCLAVPVALAVQRSLPPRPGERPVRGAARQVAWRLGATGLSGALLAGAEAGVRSLDARLGAGGRLASVPLALPVGACVSAVLARQRRRPGGSGPEGRTARASTAASSAVAAGLVAASAGTGYAEYVGAQWAGNRLAAVLPGPPELWRVAGHGAFLATFGAGVSAVWHRAMQRLEAGTSAVLPVIETGEAARWVPPSSSGAPGSLVAWETLGREGRRHVLTSVRPEPMADRPHGVPDLSIETVMGEPARATPVQVYVGLDSAPTPRERVDLALAELDRSGAFDRSLIVLVSPTGTGYVDYVAVAATQYLARGDVATVTLQYSRRPSPLSLRMIAIAREQNRLLWLSVLQRLRERPGPRPEVVLFGESLGAHTSQDVFLHWGTLGPESLGVDRALWLGTPYASKWMHQVTGPDRLDVDRDAIAVVNDFGQLEQLGAERRARLRYVLLSHDNDGVTRFGLDLLTTPPAWLGPGRPALEAVAGGSPRGIPPGMRWRPITTFFQTLIDMKNAQVPGPYGAWAHDYRADLPRFISEVYRLPVTPEQLARVEEALVQREQVREQLFSPPAVGAPR